MNLLKRLVERLFKRYEMPSKSKLMANIFVQGEQGFMGRWW